MDWRLIFFLYEVRKLPKSFELWRDNIIKESDRKCDILSKQLLNKEPFLYLNYLAIKNLPKTLRKLTRQMCSCNEYCVEYSMYYTTFDSNCKLYDLRDYINDDGYYDSELVNYKIIYNRLEPKDYFVEEYALQTQINDELVNLCKNIKYSYRRLKCKAYELKDYCNNNNTCYEHVLGYKINMTPNESKNNCLNLNFKNDLVSLHDKLKIPILHITGRYKREVSFDNEILESSYKMNYGCIIAIASLLSLMGIFILKNKYHRMTIFVLLLLILGFGFYTGN